MPDTVASLRKQIAESEKNLELIAERKAEFPEQEQIPLALIKNERRWQEQLVDLQARLARLGGGNPPSPPPARKRLWLWLAVAATCLLLIVVAYAIVRTNGRTNSAATPTVGTSAARALVVTPEVPATEVAVSEPPPASPPATPISPTSPPSPTPTLWPGPTPALAEPTRASPDAGPASAPAATTEMVQDGPTTAPGRLDVIGQPSPPAESIISADNADKLTQWLSVTTEEIPSDLAFSPDGKTLAVAAGQILLYKLPTMEVGRWGDGPADTIMFSHDWSRIAFVHAYGKEVQVWDVAQRSKVQSFPIDSVNGIALSPDGKLLAVATHKVMQVLNVSDGSVVDTLAPEELLDAKSVAFSPDQHVLAGSGYGIYLWRTDAWQETPQVVSSGWLSHLTFAPDGARLAAILNLQTPKVFKLPEGDDLHDFSPKKSGNLSTSASAAGLAFSPDGRLLAAASGGSTTIRLWSVSEGRELVQRTGHLDTITAATFAPNGTALATAGQDKTVRLWGVGKP